MSSPEASQETSTMSPEEAAECAALAAEQVVETFAARTRMPSATMTLVQAGHPVITHSFGQRVRHGDPAGADTHYRVGSLTKSFTALAVLHLRNQGLIDLDAPVRRYLPWFQLAAPGAGGLTVRHLLTHTSGIPAAAHNVVWQAPARIRHSLHAGVRALAVVVPNAAPGQRWQYSNANYNILGLIVETVSGVPYAHYIRDQLLAPLGMDATTFDVATACQGPLARGDFPFFSFYRQTPLYDETWLAPAGGALFSSAADMARYAIFHPGGGPPSVPPRGEIEEAHTGIVATKALITRRDRYGFGWFDTPVAGRRIVWHDGGVAGYSAMLVLVPEKQAEVVVLLGATTYSTSTRHLVKALADALGGQPAPAPRRDPLPAAVPVWVLTALLRLAPLARRRLSGFLRSPVTYGLRGWPPDLLLTYLSLLATGTLWSIKAAGAREQFRAPDRPLRHRRGPSPR